MLTLDTIPVPNPNVVSRVVENEAVLVMPEAGQVKVLNQVGASIWQLTDGQRSIAEIANRVCEEFEVNLNQCQADTLNFIAELQQKGVVNCQP